MAPGWVDVGSDEDEGNILPDKLPGVGIVIEVKVTGGDEAVVIELEVWMALKSRCAITAFVPVVVRW